eukprot:1161295-Pelagomonas_calceolata.AAC.10
MQLCQTLFIQPYTLLVRSEQTGASCQGNKRAEGQVRTISGPRGTGNKQSSIRTFCGKGSMHLSIGWSPQPFSHHEGMVLTLEKRASRSPKVIQSVLHLTATGKIEQMMPISGQQDRHEPRKS